MIEDMKAYISRLILANDSDENAPRPKLKFSGFSIQSRLPLVEHQHLSFLFKTSPVGDGSSWGEAWNESVPWSICRKTP